MSTEQNQSQVHVVQGHATPRPADVWLGPEIMATQTTEIPPRSPGEIPIDLENLRAEVPASQIHSLLYSGRSSLAQRGGDALKEGARAIRRALIATDETRTTIPLANRSDRPLTIAEGPIAQTYTRRGTYLRGAHLHQRIDNGAIHTKEDSTDWWIHRDATGRAIGIGYVLEQPEKRIKAGTEPIPVPSSARGTFREQLEPYLAQIQPGEDYAIQIGTTVSEIGFAPGILGIIDPTIDTSATPEGLHVVNEDHINSVLLSAHDHWQIRTETKPNKHEDKTDQLSRRGIVFQFLTVDLPTPDSQ